MQHAAGWVKKGHSVTWIASTYDGAKPQEDMQGVTIVRIGGLLFLHLRVAKYLVQHGNEFDVIVDEIHGVPFFAPIFTRTPVVAFIHEVADEIWDYMYPFPFNVLGKLLESWYFSIYRGCEFWTDAPSTVEELTERGIPKTLCHAIPCPITRKTEDRRLKTENRIRKEKNPTFLFVSRVVRMKGVEEVIKAFGFIHRESPDARLWIVGGGETKYIRTLEKMVREYTISDAVIFHGSVNESKKYELMARSHILLHASVKEGWGLVVLEAASVGTPSVVYNVPGLRDVVHSGTTGVVLEKNSPTHMAVEAVKLYADTTRYASYQAAGKRWVACTTWKSAIESSILLLSHAMKH
jgi:glycosyltransferase involved in cell wall biosynthesis